jgi:hypothetical protein
VEAPYGLLRRDSRETLAFPRNGHGCFARRRYPPGNSLASVEGSHYRAVSPIQPQDPIGPPGPDCGGAWRSLAREGVLSFAIITTTPNALCAELPDRMPVTLGPGELAGLAWDGGLEAPETA